MALTRPRYSQIYDTDYKQSVRVATTEDVGNLLATGNMTNTIDGKSLAVADRILVKDQSDIKQNGIYRVVTAGTGSDGTWVRALDADASDKVTSGMTTTVAEGDTHISKTFKLSTPDPITLGVTGLTFINPFVAGTAAGGNTQIQFNDSGVAGATAGLTFNKTGNVLTVGGNINVTGSILPSANITYDLGSPTQRWRDGWFSGTTIHIGTESMSVGTDGTWAFTSGGSTVQLGIDADFNPPNANISGNVTATNYLFANGTPVMTVVGTMISVANTAMKGYADSAVSTLTSNAAVQAGDIATLYANVGVQSGSIVTANTAMKGYVDAVTTAWTANAGAQSGAIASTNTAITTANTAMKGYVDGQITSLVNGSPSTLDTLNELASALGNDANLSVTLTSLIGNVQANVTSANTAMKGYVDAINTTLTSNAAVQSGAIDSATTAITTANTAMKGYVDSGLTARVTSVSGTAPVTSSGGTTPAISMAAATASANGYMTSTYASKLDGIAAGATNVTNTNQLTNGAGFVTASVTLTTAAQPNITSTGTLTGLTLSGTITGKTGTGGNVAASNDSGSMSVRGDSTNAAVISFHRPGAYAINMGLDTDNVFKIGGWSDGASTYRMQVTSAGVITGTATTARYADLAEVYRSDRNYIPGTVLVFGGTSEVTVSLISHDTKVIGVVSTNPAYLMNSELEGVAVALQGRVPCRVLGPVVKGDRVVTSDVRGVAERLDMTKYQPGCIIGKALDSVPDGEIATIEVVVGRN
jgi:hypothetical protein